ncbi:MAG: SDR family oxidoreductase [Kiritimatiellae bacterium]|nr:SDR family oxidoreductase [Kiritimatiellia bacterium]
MNRLKDKVALITVDADGLAPAVAAAYAEEGARVAVAGPDANQLASLAKAVTDAGGACLTVVMDPSDAASCERGVGEVVAKYGCVDVLCNLAGEYPRTGPLHEVSEADFDRMVKVNISSVVLTARFGIPAFRNGGRQGSIINVSHAAALSGVAGTSLLAATKGALLNLTRCMAMQGAKQGYRANCVCVGNTFVPVVPSMLDEDDWKATGSRELAPTFVYLASDESRHMCGHILCVDDGMSAWIQEPGKNRAPAGNPGRPVPRPPARSDSPVRGKGCLEGQVALITGGGGAIAHATAALFAQEGAKVALVDIVEERAAATAAEIRAAGGEACALSANALCLADCERAVAETVSRYGALTVLINLVGMFGKGHQSVDKVALNEWNLMMDLNLKSVFLMSKAAAPALIRSGGGAIVNTGTLAAVVGRDGGGYGASKSGVLALTRAMAADYFHNKIRVNAVCPSGVDTPMFRGPAPQNDPASEKLRKKIDAARNSDQGLSTPEQIAPSFLFLASDQLSPKVTGHILLAENGYSTIRR